jgi:hypothetical protein
MIEKPSGTPVNKGDQRNKPLTQEAPGWLNNEKTITPKALILILLPRSGRPQDAP